MRRRPPKRQRFSKLQAAREAAVAEAEGQAEAIRLVQQATADGIRMIVDSDPNEKVISLKSLEAFTAAANGQATKIIIPSEIQGLAGLAASLKGIVEEDRA